MLYWNIFWVERLRKQGFWYELNGRTITKHINTLEWGRAQTWNIHHDFTEGPLFTSFMIQFRVILPSCWVWPKQPVTAWMRNCYSVLANPNSKYHASPFAVFFQHKCDPYIVGGSSIKHMEDIGGAFFAEFFANTISCWQCFGIQ